MIYGATGYTGQLLAEEAVRRGHRPLLAGRSPDRLRPLAEKLGLKWVAARLDDPQGLRQAVSRTRLVFHAAGPFVETSRPMIAACLEAGCHYIDVTGEIPVFQHTFSQHEAALQRSLTLISGAGFDVVPTDCLANHVAARFPGADTLEIAIAALGGASSGTMQSMLEMLPSGGRVRRDGRLQAYPFGQGARRLRFPDRERTVLPIPWGDLETAYRSTGIPNITTYMAFPRRQARLLRFTSPFTQKLISIAAIRRLARGWVARSITGPDKRTRQTARARAWARVTRGSEHAEAWLETCEAYQFTAIAGVRCVEKVLAGCAPGALTPAQAFGSDFVFEIEGTLLLA